MRKLNIFLILLLSSLVILSAFMIYKQVTTQQNEINKFDELLEIVEDTSGVTEETTEIPKNTEPSEQQVRNLKPLFERNSDCIGWICIDFDTEQYTVEDKGTRKVHYTNKDIIEENILDAFPMVYSPPVRPSRRATTGGQVLSQSDEPLIIEPEHQVRTD